MQTVKGTEKPLYFTHTISELRDKVLYFMTSLMMYFMGKGYNSLSVSLPLSPKLSNKSLVEAYHYRNFVSTCDMLIYLHFIKRTTSKHQTKQSTS